MTSRKSYKVRQYFGINKFNQTICKRGGCKGKSLSSQPANLERHLRLMHSEIYSTYLQEKTGTILQVGSTSEDSKIDCRNKIQLSKVLYKNNLEMAIVELFTRHELALHIAEVPAFKMIVQTCFDDINIGSSAANVMERVHKFAQKTKAEIVKGLKGQLLSLCIDVGSIRQQLCVMSISVQFIKNKTTTIQTLAMKELNTSCTVSCELLQSLIFDSLSDYEVDLNQIITITTSNKNFNIPNKLNCWNNEYEEHIIDNTFDEILEEIKPNFTSDSLTSMHYGTQILQQCVDDILQAVPISTKLDRCRFVVEKLKSQIYLNKRPKLDDSSNWVTTHSMLNDLLELREVIATLSVDCTDLVISKDIWNFMEEFLKELEFVRNANEQLQSATLCYSDLYIIIMDILFKIGNLPASETQLMLVAALNTRKAELFENELFNAAVFLDPRIKICLKSDETRRAISCIERLHKCVISLKENLPQEFNETMDASDVSLRKCDAPRTFADFLSNLDVTPQAEQPVQELLSQLENDLMWYERQIRLPLDANILDFWYNKNNSLTVIANIILAIPVTQAASTERLIAALRYISSSQDKNLTPLQLEEILFVKFNGNFSYED